MGSCQHLTFIFQNLVNFSDGTCRKAGSVHCTAQGLEPEKVKTLTKHKMETFQKSYMCEMLVPVLTTLAGFNPIDPHDRYFVARTTIGLPGDLSPSNLSTILFPHVTRWKNEVASDDGDKSEGGDVFLTTVLPFLTEVIVQDGIFGLSDIHTILQCRSSCA